MSVKDENAELAKEQIQMALRERADFSAKRFAQASREETVANLKEDVQGEEGLIPYVGEVRQDRNDQGQFEFSYSFEIEHPTAKLHERGGEIEPTYSRAMVEGWDRDGFYEALDDCNYMVTRKRFLKRAVQAAKRNADLSE